MIDPDKHSSRTHGCMGEEWGILELVTSLDREINISEEMEGEQSLGCCEGWLLA